MQSLLPYRNWGFRHRRRGSNFGPEFGIDFRDTSGYVTDPANFSYVIGSAVNGPGEVYPVLRGGHNVGWNAGNSVQTRDRNDAVSPKLAGLHYILNNVVGGMMFEYDVPAGTYSVRLAMGDSSGAAAFGDQYITLSDNTTLRATIAKNWTGAQNLAHGHFLDANLNEFADAAGWVSGNTPLTGIVISSGELMVRIGKGTAGGGTPEVDATCICHLSLLRTA